MLPFRRILLPVDYSEPCRAVVPYALDMLRHFRAELTLVHAYAPSSAAVLAGTERELMDPSLSAQLYAAEQERLCEYGREMFPGMHAEVFVKLGEPGNVICSAAQHQEPDLIMLATRGHGPVRRFLLGSVTAKVLHDSTAVVWTGVGSALVTRAPDVPYRRMICALDESPEAEAVLKGAVAVALSYGAELSLLHVIQAQIGPEANAYRTELLDAEQARLRDLKAKLGIDVPATIAEGTVAEALQNEVLQCRADLVIAGRGRYQGALSRAWSHLYSLVRESPCPVLSI